MKTKVADLGDPQEVGCTEDDGLALVMDKDGAGLAA